ncbi:MAG: molybdate ABC transporter permease subunit [Cellvibrionaceae bacterium]|nr:molybdate ABC transporter permease subunit [Cellvibrionaceae bacterium]
MNLFSSADWQAIWLTLKLAALVSVLLILLGTPLAWWLARSRSRFKHWVAALTALPLVLPPSVLGFYLLLAMGPEGPLGKVGLWFGAGTLAFSFPGLVIASMIYSLPFVVQPIQNAMETLGQRPLEVAATLGAGPIDTFFRVVLPLTRPGFISAAVLGFAHTLGEFGVVLMVGGNIPGVTQVVSVQIYQYVEAINYRQAHLLSASLLIFSLVLITLLYSFNRGGKRQHFSLWRAPRP